jgi:hypothetical protein
MKTRIIGDIHGAVYDYKSFCIHDFKGPSIQVGDFGIGFASDYWHDNVAAWQEAHPHHRFIRGNHDDPARCKTMPGYIPDGLIEGDVMFVGGAWSIDRAYREEGISWWRDEELSIQEFNTLIDVYAAVKPRVMITHDAPEQVTDEMFIKSGLAIGGSNACKINTRTGQALQAMFDTHQPDVWIFGHWHHTMHYTHGRTHFVCLGELEYIDVTLTDSEKMLEELAILR